MKTIMLLGAAILTLTVCPIASAQLPVAGKYNGLFSEADGIRHHSAGFISVKVNPTATFSGFVMVEGEKVVFAGKNFPTNVTTWSRTNKYGREPLVISLVATLPLETQQIEGTISNSSWVANVRADRAIWSLLNPTTNFVNNFTFVIPGTNNEADPAGDGVAWMTNTSGGFTKILGNMADRSVLGLKVSISTNGQVPVYMGLYRGRVTYSNEFTHVNGATKVAYHGFVMGEMVVTNAETPPVANLTWIKTQIAAAVPASVTNYYPAGFSNGMAIMSSIYTPPSSGDWVLNMAEGSVAMQDGNLTSALTNTFIVTNTPTARAIFDAPNTIKQLLNFVPSSGRMGGAFYHPDTTLRTLYYAVPLQNQNIARGFFLGTNKSGSIRIE